MVRSSDAVTEVIIVQKGLSDIMTEEKMQSRHPRFSR
jgi:hypothetical protein